MLFAMRERWQCAAALLFAAASASCSPKSKRDIQAPAREMTYEDQCGLQDYFNQRRAVSLAEPKAANEVVTTTTKGQVVGEGAYRLRDPLSRRRFARLLREEYSGVDDKIIRAIERGDGDVVVRVRWWDAGQIRRLRPDDDVVVESAAGVIELPPNMCVSDLLFGKDLYARRARYLENEVDLATGKPLRAPPEASSP
jgi:hypothetical protein